MVTLSHRKCSRRLRGLTLLGNLGLVAGFGVVIGAAYMGDRIVTRQGRPDRVTVIYWEKWTGSEGEEMRKVTEAFNRSQDKIFVKYLSISGVNSKTLLATSGGNPPDIAGLWLENIYQFADAGAMTDLTDMAKAAGLTRDYYIPAYYDPLTFHDRLWAFPSTPASTALHVRADLVPKEYATPETFPKTIEGLDALTEKISTKEPSGELKMAGFLPGSPGWWTWAWGPFFGATLLEGNKITVNGPESVRAFTWIEQYAKRFGPKQVQTFQSGFGNFASTQDPFIFGKTATELNGVWKANYVHLYSKDLKWFAVPFPYPQDRPDLAGHGTVSQDILIIPRGAKHPKEAFEFIKYVQRQDVMEKLCAAHGKNSPLNKVSDEFYRTHPNKFIRLFDQLARSPKAIKAPKLGLYPQMTAELNVAYEQVSTLQKSPKQALDDAQVRIDGMWKQYQEQVLDK